MLLGEAMEKFRGSKNETFVYVNADGHSFSSYKTKGQTIYLNCRNKGCNVNAVLNTLENAVKQKKEHNHMPDAHMKEKLLFKKFLQDKAQMTNESYEKIYMKAEKLYPNAARETGNLEFHKSSMQRARAKTIPYTPNNLEELKNVLGKEVALKYSLDLDDPPRALLKDLYYADDDSKVMIFVSPRVLDVVKQRKIINIQSDATYKILPRMEDTYQIFIISFESDRKIYPFIYAIMQKKSEVAYKKVFEILKEVLDTTTVKLSMMDYEMQYFLLQL